MDSISKYLKKNFISSVGKIVTIALVTLLLLPLIINRIGLQLYGVVSLTLLFSGVSSLVDLGLSKAVILLNGENKLTSHQVASSALAINIIIISFVFIIFISLQLLSVDLLGNKLNISDTDKFLVLNVGFILFALMLLNNLCRAILEAYYMMHVVSLSLATYTPILYLSIFILSFITSNLLFYVLAPMILTVLMLIFNIVYIKIKTNVKLCKVNIAQVKYVFKTSLGFLNLGLVNSMVIPALQYLFVLIVADVGLYALFDLSIKIAILANSVIISLSMPMFAVFSKEAQTKTHNMLRIALKVFYISLGIYLAVIIGFYALGNYAITFLELAKDNSELLFTITLALIIGIGSSGVVEVFYRYFMGTKKLKKAFLVKLIIPVASVLLFLLLNNYSYIVRFVYAYGISVILSSIVVGILFLQEKKSVFKAINV
ncbi:hypothetical protein MHTCC0001_33910 [Flavobacteriaceae bacterium MHTCC 0001]